MNSQRPELQATNDYRVLVRGATARDDAMTVRELRRAGIDAQSCASLEELRREVFDGCGVVVLAEEMLVDRSTTHLLRGIAAQEPWSDLWLLILARQGADSPIISQAMGHGSGAHAPDEYYLIDSVHPNLGGFDDAALSFAEYFYELAK